MNVWIGHADGSRTRRPQCHSFTPAPRYFSDGRKIGFTYSGDVLPFRLPSEAEWEYAARAGTTTLTFRGDLVPSETDLLDHFGVEQRVLTSENAFGLAAMGSLGELCADTYVPGYAGAPTDAAPRHGDGVGVIRGGAADMSPWQGCNEWLAMLSAARGPLDMFAAVRPVLDLPATAVAE
ncbi:formylglycine-generating enzyme family protein [Actinomadura chokoriensis]